jgi:hypothetical protein
MISRKKRSIDLFLLVTALAFSHVGFSQEKVLYDEKRDRHIPIEVTVPKTAHVCQLSKPCPVAFVSSGYGVRHDDYSFITQALNELGYLVVSIQHELEGDPPLSGLPPFVKTRRENWLRGVQTLKTVKLALKDDFARYDFNRVTLIGHSNGGDISALFTKSYEREARALITLDHRREPLPRSQSLRVLTLRASDFPADNGVLLTPQELAKFNVKQIKIDKARHNDMTDYGPDWLKEEIALAISRFLSASAH